MKAAVITIGDEILLGQITDTNSRYIARELALLGIETLAMHTVADDMLENFVGSILGNKEEVHKLYDKVGERKVIEAVAAQMKVNEKNVTPEEFQKLA